MKNQKINLSHEAIAKRAYEIYLTRGCVAGNAVQDWCQAETELAVEKQSDQKEQKTSPIKIKVKRPHAYLKPSFKGGSHIAR